MPTARLLVVALAAFGALFAAPVAAPLAAQAPAAPAATRAMVVDPAGVLRWRDDRTEVALYGANYTIPSASDFRAAGYLGLDRKRQIDQDLAHFARMGWDAIRLSFWGDWENSDSAGNLLANEHLDLQDYLVARARERGIYMLLSPIVTYEATWPDATSRTRQQPGFSRFFEKCALGTSAPALASQVNYLRQLMHHVNPYTGVAYKDEPAIPLVEMVNEPCHHPEDIPGSVRYIDALVDAVRSTGSRQLLFHNVSQDFRIAPAIQRSRIQGSTFGWYPGGLNSGRELRGNFLRAVDDFPPMRDTLLRGRPSLVYEFDAPDQRTATMYPAMARTFRQVGAQFAAMFAYDMLGTASRNLGWQTHYLSLAYTPRKAMGAVLAAEAMRRLPRGRTYGAYPANTRFGDFRVSAEDDLAELVSADAFIHAGDTRSVPPRPDRLVRVAGVGSSPVVEYGGLGAWFLDRVRPGVWRLEVYPDAVAVRDPFELQSPDKIVTRAIHRAHAMRVTLPDLGRTFTVQPVAGAAGASADGGARATDGRVTVRPGVYVLSARGPVAASTLPARLGRLRFDEFHAPAADTGAAHVEWLAPPQLVAGRVSEVAVRVVDDAPPDSVVLYARAVSGGDWFRAHPMRASGAYDYRAVIPADTLREGLYDFAVTVARGASSTTWPERLAERPWDWNFNGQRFWRAAVVRADAPLRLFGAADAERMAFSRVGDGGRRGSFRVMPSSASGEPVFRLDPPSGAEVPDEYVASHYVGDRIAARGAAAPRRLRLRLRGTRPGQQLHVALVERDGTAWEAAVAADTGWSEQVVELAALRATRSALLPHAFPGHWNDWAPPAAGRGGRDDAVRPAAVERLQLQLRGVRAPGGAGAVEVESVTLEYR